MNLAKFTWFEGIQGRLFDFNNSLQQHPNCPRPFREPIIHVEMFGGLLNRTTASCGKTNGPVEPVPFTFVHVHLLQKIEHFRTMN